MKKYILPFLMLITFLASSPVTYAATNHDKKNNVYLSYCSNFGTGVSYSFQSCVNSNFSDIGRELGGYLSYCSNFGDGVSYSFTSCVNQGFREAARLLDNSIYLSDCMNFDQKNLDYSFISCVNSNYGQISRAISSRP